MEEMEMEMEEEVPMPKRRALITMNLQKDFCTGGAQPVSDSEAVIRTLSQLRKRDLFSLVVHVRSVYSINHHGFIAANPGFKVTDMFVSQLPKP